MFFFFFVFFLPSTLCMLGNFACFLNCCLWIFFFFCINFLKKKSSDSLDPDQARHFVGLDLGPDCLQRLSADDKSRH